MAAAATITFDLTPPSKEQFDALVVDLNDEERHVLLEHGNDLRFRMNRDRFLER